MSPITLTSDFGTRDGYVAQMKGVILGIAPYVQIVDVTHDIAPFSLLEAAFVMQGISRHFPTGTIHVAVVDPGVGSMRRGIVLHAREQLFVGPDNGLFSMIMASESRMEVREISNPDYIAPDPHPTFHGRDIFAPVAAHLAAGRALAGVGPMISNPVTLDIPEPFISSDRIQGEVVYVDRFGNLITNVEERLLPKRVRRVRVGDHSITGGIRRFFGEVAEGSKLVLVNSFGFLEIAVNQQAASTVFGLGKGTPVTIEWS